MREKKKHIFKENEVLEKELEETELFKENNRNCEAIFIGEFPRDRFVYCTIPDHICAYQHHWTLGWVLFEACGIERKRKEDRLKDFRLKYLLLDLFNSESEARDIEKKRSTKTVKESSERISRMIKDLIASQKNKIPIFCTLKEKPTCAAFATWCYLEDSLESNKKIEIITPHLRNGNILRPWGNTRDEWIKEIHSILSSPIKMEKYCY